MNLKYWRPRYLNSLSAIYLITMLSSALDIVWILIDGTNQYRWLHHIVNIAYLLCFDFVCFLWLNYCAEHYPFRLWKNKWQHFLYLLPALLIGATVALSPWTGWIYVIDAAGVYSRGPLFIIQDLVYLYIFAASGLSLLACSRVSYTSEKRGFMVMALFPLPPLLLGTLQLCMPPGSLPTTQFSIVLSLLMQFIFFLESNVTQDCLTGLSNRYVLDRALNTRMNGSRRGRTSGLYVVMGDLDRFKDINDTYGHMEGDRALKLTAQTLKDIFHGSSAVLARMGGDEFAIILEADSPTQVRQVMAQITRELERAGENEPYNLSMSLGMARYTGQKTAIEFLKEADRALYRVKRARARRNSTV